MSKPYISVIIPTRERADTLRYALQSCAAQSYDHVEFIVSNNASTDETEAVVQSFRDQRIRLVTTDCRLSMRENWEFALSHAKGDYVTFLGDDDALMPGGLERLAQILSTEHAAAVKWQAPIYTWPGSDRPTAGMVRVDLGNQIAYVRSKAALNAARWGYLYFQCLPVIYYGAVSMELIRNIKKKTGEFFQCEIPDVYSALVVAAMTDEYLYTQMPLTVAGISSHSNGTTQFETAAVQQGTPTALFFSENQLGPHPDFLELKDVPSSLHACVTDALLRLRDHALDGQYYVPLWYRLLLVTRDLSALPDADLTSQNHPLRLYSKRKNLHWLYILYLRLWAKRAKRARAGLNANSNLADADRFFIDLRLFGVTNVYEASVLLDKLLRELKMKPMAAKVNGRSILFGKLLSGLFARGSFRVFKRKAFS